MNDLEMLPDDYEKLHQLLLKFNRGLNKSLKGSTLKNKNGRTELYFFFADLSNLIEHNKHFLGEDLFMNLFYMRKNLVSDGR
jgi:hypothetical protein